LAQVSKLKDFWNNCRITVFCIFQCSNFLVTLAFVSQKILNKNFNFEAPLLFLLDYSAHSSSRSICIKIFDAQLFFHTPKKNLLKFFCSRGCSDRRIFWKILLLHKNIFCTSSNSFAPNKYLRFGKNIYAFRRISSSVGDICSACEDFIKMSEFYRRYIFCARRNIFCARRKSHPKEDFHPLQKINHLHQKNKFICNRKYSSVTTSSAAEDSFFGCTERARWRVSSVIEGKK
jgi:hypothetical protein